MDEKYEKTLSAKEADALKEAIREVKEAQDAVQLAFLNDKLARVSRLLGVVQV